MTTTRAAALGLLGAPIEGPTHFSQFDPLAYAVWATVVERMVESRGDEGREHYDVVHTIVGISESRRTESFWTQSAITPAGGGTTIATVLLHQGVFKDSYPDYRREAAADAPA